MILLYISFLSTLEVLNRKLLIYIYNTQPFNAFLSGFGATVGQFVLTASLRMQTAAENRVEFSSISPERYLLFNQ